MNIKFLVDCRYRPVAPEDKRFEGCVTVRLPKTGRYISQCYLGKIGEYEIDYDSGSDIGDLIEITTHFYAGSMEELDRIIENAIEDYRKQVIKNVEVIQKLKGNNKKEIIKDFPEPIDADLDLFIIKPPYELRF